MGYRGKLFKFLIIGYGLNGIIILMKYYVVS